MRVTPGRSSISPTASTARCVEQLELTPNHNLKIRYENYEEARAALLEEGINMIGSRC